MIEGLLALISQAEAAQFDRQLKGFEFRMTLADFESLEKETHYFITKTIEETDPPKPVLMFQWRPPEYAGRFNGIPIRLVENLPSGIELVKS